MYIMFSNKLAITWRLFGGSGDYLAIFRGFYGFGTFMGHIVHISKPQESRHEPDNRATKVSNLLKKEIFVNPNNNKPQIHSPPPELSACYAKGRAGNADERRYVHAARFGKTTHRKGRKERKAIQQESLRPLRSLRLNVFFIPAHERAPQPVFHLRSSGVGG